MPLTRLKPEDRDVTANWVCVHAIVPPTGVDVLRKPVHADVIVRVGDLSRQEFLVT